MDKSSWKRFRGKKYVKGKLFKEKQKSYKKYTFLKRKNALNEWKKKCLCSKSIDLSDIGILALFLAFLTAEAATLETLAVLFGGRRR